MRRVKIVVTQPHGALPALLLATLLPAAATCAADVAVERPAGGASATSASAGGAGGQGGDASSGIGGFGPATTTTSGGGAECANPEEYLQTFIVEVPPEGVPAEPGQICAVTAQPVESNRAARVTLTRYSQDPAVAMGFIAIEPSLSASVVGAPTVVAIDAAFPALLAMQITDIQPTAGGFSFHAAWPQPFAPTASPWSKLTVKVALEIACDPGGPSTRLVESLTHINICTDLGDDGAITWVSSGDECNVCGIIAEMAPSPIVPDKVSDALPLGRAMRLRVVVLARVGRAIVLLAENDGGRGMRYGWHPSGGHIEALADDIVVWTPPPEPGPHLVQAVVHGDEAAAVASYLWKETL